jgi:predicted permease
LIVTSSQVTPEYFNLLGIPLVRGRLPNDFDTDSTPLVAVVNAAMAQKYWPNEEVIGQRIKLSARATQWATIIGVVGDTRAESLTEPWHPQIYASLYQRQGKHLAIFVRGQSPIGALERDLRAQVQTINPALPVFGAKTLTETVSASLAPRRFAMAMIAAFALVASLLSGLGIYGVMSYMVNERIHEIGVRLALGAQRGEILRAVLWQGIRLALIGAVPGILGALVVARVLGGMLYGVRPWDPLSFAAVTGGLSLIAMAACYFPARRAVAVDPMDAMRY